MAEWISVNEMIPTSHRDMLITDGEEITIGWYHVLKSEWTVGSVIPAAHKLRRNVTHWMPLPELPKEGER